MRTMSSLRACRVQAGTWLVDCWQKSGMIEAATKMPAVCKLWGEPRPCCFKAACTPRRIAAWGASNPCATLCINSPGRRRKVNHGPGSIYERKRAEGKSHTVAVRALANVWVRIIFAMWLHHQCYESATFEQAQQQHARKVAEICLHRLTTTHSCVKCSAPCRFCLFPPAGLDHLVQASGTVYDLLPDGGH